MKKLIFSLFLLIPFVGSLSSCREQSKIPEPQVDSVPLILPQINPAKSFFGYDSSRVAIFGNHVRPVFEFTINPTQVAGVQIETVEVYKTFVRDNVFGPRVKVKDLTNFPAVVTINSQEALTGLFTNNTPQSFVKAPTAFAPNRIFGGGKDAVLFTFEYVLSDGRRVILTPLTTPLTTAGTTGAVTGNQAAAPYAALATFR